MYELTLTTNVHSRQISIAGVAAILLLSSAVAEAQSQGLQGLWRGSGYVIPAEGQKERVRCRVTFTRRSAGSYAVQAKCASKSADISQTGQVRKTGSNRYAGAFYNSDYNVRGQIRIRVQGNQQFVNLSSESGSGSLRLFRR